MNKNDKSSADEVETFRKRISFFLSCSLVLCLLLSQRRDSFHHKTQHNTTNFYFSDKTQNTLADSQSAHNATILFSLVRFINKQREEKKEVYKNGRGRGRRDASQRKSI